MADPRIRRKKHFDRYPGRKRGERPSWILIARSYLQTIVDEAAAELLVSHPEGPFEAVADFETFVDDCVRNLYDYYFHFHMLTWKFEIFEDFECTKPMPITNEDRYTEFTYLVFNGNPPLLWRVEDAITNYLEAVGRTSNLETVAHAGSKYLESTSDLSNDTGTTPGPGTADSDADRAESSWQAITISFLSDERVQVRHGIRIETRNFNELGFADRRNGTPNQAWVTLRVMAEENGIIRNGSKTGAAWPNVEKRMQAIRKVLRNHFALSSDPVPFVRGTGYRTVFKLGCARSFDA